MFTRSHLRGYALWVGLVDLISLASGSFLAVVMRIGQDELAEYIYGHIESWVTFFGSVVLANYLSGSYKVQYSYSRFNVVVMWLFSLIFSVIVLSVFSYAWLFTVLLGRGILLLSIVWYSIISLILRMIAHHGLFSREFFVCRTVILGPGRRNREIRNIVENEYVMPVHKVIAYINISGEGAEHKAGSPLIEDGVAVMNSTAETFADIVRSLNADLLVTVFDDPKVEKMLYPYLRHLRFEGVEVLDTLGAMETYLGKTPIDLIDEEAVMRVAMESGLPVVRGFKRVYDVVVAVVLGLLYLPIAGLMAICIKLSDPVEKVLYSQLRVGQFGRIFRIYKFRTMRAQAEEGSGPVWASGDDERITGVGKILRKFRLDEMPQFWNILKGEMSIVGPRPERPELHVELEKKIPYYAERSNVMPGLTGWAQVRYPYGNSVEDSARKFEYDLYYIKYLSLSLDLQIILRTIRIVLFGLERKT